MPDRCLVLVVCNCLMMYRFDLCILQPGVNNKTLNSSSYRYFNFLWLINNVATKLPHSSFDFPRLINNFTTKFPHLNFGKHLKLGQM